MYNLVSCLCVLLVISLALSLPLKETVHNGCPSLPQARCVAPMDCIGGGRTIYGRCVNQYGLCCSMKTPTTTAQPTKVTEQTTIQADFMEKYDFISLQEIYESILDDQEAKLEDDAADQEYILLKKTLLEHLIESEKKHTLKESLANVEDHVEELDQGQNVLVDSNMESMISTDDEETNLELDLTADQPIIITGDNHNNILIEPELIKITPIVDSDTSDQQEKVGDTDDSTPSKSHTVTKHDEIGETPSKVYNHIAVKPTQFDNLIENIINSNPQEVKPSNYMSVPIGFLQDLSTTATAKPVELAQAIKTSEETHEFIYLNKSVVPSDETENHLQNLEQEDTEKESMEPYHHSWKDLNNSKTEDLCGRPMFPRPRVIGGTKVARGAWPWQALLVVHHSDKEASMCGASLINRVWLVTAAHCLDNVQPHSVTVRLGMTNYRGEGETESQTKMRLRDIIRHPQYNTNTLNYDLALIRLESSIPYSAHILPVCLPKDDHFFVNDRGIVTGWGATKYGSDVTAAHMLEGEVPILSNRDCEKMYLVKNIKENIASHSVCAGYEDGRIDTCDGDSGGPLVSYRDNRWVLVGVSSWGTACGRSNEPGVYARVSEFRDWIHQQIEL